MSLDGLSPAYRWLDLHVDGSLDTGVVFTGAAPLSATA